MELKPGDKVRIIKGDWAGVEGVYIEYLFERYMVRDADGKLIACKDGEVQVISLEQEEEDVIEMPVFTFPISQDDFSKHLEFLLDRSLAQVGEVGPEQAFFSFQEFEGKSVNEVLLELLLKIEQGMALFAQAHVFIGRMFLALEGVHDQN